MGCFLEANVSHVVPNLPLVWRHSLSRTPNVLTDQEQFRSELWAVSMDKGQYGCGTRHSFPTFPCFNYCSERILHWWVYCSSRKKGIAGWLISIVRPLDMASLEESEAGQKQRGEATPAPHSNSHGIWCLVFDYEHLSLRVLLRPW